MPRHLLHLPPQGDLRAELVHEVSRSFLLLPFPADLDLHVESREDLDGGLADTAQRHGELRLGEEVVDDLERSRNKGPFSARGPTLHNI